MKSLTKRPEKKSPATSEIKGKIAMEDRTLSKNSLYLEIFNQPELDLNKSKLVGKQIPHDSALGHVTGEA